MANQSGNLIARPWNVKPPARPVKSYPDQRGQRHHPLFCSRAKDQPAGACHMRILLVKTQSTEIVEDS